MDPYGDFPWRSVKLLGDEYYMLARFSFPTVMRYNPIELSAGLIMGNEATIIWSLKFRLIIPQFGFVLWMIPISASAAPVSLLHSCPFCQPHQRSKSCLGGPCTLTHRNGLRIQVSGYLKKTPHSLMSHFTWSSKTTCHFKTGTSSSNPLFDECCHSHLPQDPKIKEPDFPGVYIIQHVPCPRQLHQSGTKLVRHFGDDLFNGEGNTNLGLCCNPAWTVTSCVLDMFCY